MVAVIFARLGQTLCFWVNFIIDTSTEFWHLTLGVGVVAFHEEAFTAHDLVFVNLLRDLLDPCGWGQLESESSDKDSGCRKDTLAELFTGNLCGLENQGEPFAGRPLNKEDDDEDQEEGPVLVEDLLKDVVLTWSNHAAVDLIEELEEHESSEDHRHVSLFVQGHSLSFTCIRSVTIVVLGAPISGLGVLFVGKVVDSPAKPDYNEHDGNHPNCDSINLAPDGLVEDLRLACDGWLVDNGGKRLHSCEGHSAENVHDEVDPNELGSVQR